MKVQKVSYKSASAAEDLARSIRETGFAVLTDHPLQHEMIHSAFMEWETFFARPESEKLAYKFNSKTQSGFFPFLSENAKNYSKKDLKEFFHFFPNTTLPPPAQRATPALFSALEALGLELLGWLNEQSPEEIRSAYSMPLNEMAKNSKDTLLRPIHYPPLNGSEESGAVRAAAHEDINLITLLPAATAPGLQVLDLNGNWHDVDCDPGSIAINSGDMLQMASQGHYPSTTHQVINPRDSDAHLPRYSMPLFIHPRNEVRLSSQYTAGEYLEERLREIGLLKTNETILTPEANL